MGPFCSLSKYIKDLMLEANMEEAKHISSPMVPSCKLSKQGSDYLLDPATYKFVVGALYYATITRPNISFAVNKVCQFMSAPFESHWTTVKRIFCYFKGSSIMTYYSNLLIVLPSHYQCLV